jgi:hypothetical protein
MFPVPSDTPFRVEIWTILDLQSLRFLVFILDLHQIWPSVQHERPNTGKGSEKSRRGDESLVCKSALASHVPKSDG